MGLVRAREGRDIVRFVGNWVGLGGDGSLWC